MRWGYHGKGISKHHQQMRRSSNNGKVFNQVYCYLCENSLLYRLESEFRPKHSTLSALIQMCDGWLQNMHNGNLNCIVFLDVQKAFDSVNHEILLNKMHEYFGMSGTQLKWFESYSSNREQQCMVNGQISLPKNISSGIPQGSISWGLYCFCCILTICPNL